MPSYNHSHTADRSLAASCRLTVVPSPLYECSRRIVNRPHIDLYDHSRGALRSHSRRSSFASHGALQSFSHQLYYRSHSALRSLSCLFMIIACDALRSFPRPYVYDRYHAALRLFSCGFNPFSTALRRNEYLTLIPSAFPQHGNAAQKRPKVVFMPLLRPLSCRFYDGSRAACAIASSPPYDIVLFPCSTIVFMSFFLTFYCRLRSISYRSVIAKSSGASCVSDEC